MESLRSLARRIRNVFSCDNDSRKKKEIAKQMILETKKARAETLYWLMDSCLEYAETIKENLQLTTDNPVVLGNVKFWIETELHMIRATWWPRKNQSIPETFWLANEYTTYILENLSEPSLSAVKYWMTLVSYTNQKFIEFRYPRRVVHRRRSSFICCFSCFTRMLFYFS